MQYIIFNIFYVRATLKALAEKYNILLQTKLSEMGVDALYSVYLVLTFCNQAQFTIPLNRYLALL